MFSGCCVVIQTAVAQVKDEHKDEDKLKASSGSDRPPVATGASQPYLQTAQDLFKAASADYRAAKLFRRVTLLYRITGINPCLEVTIKTVNVLETGINQLLCPLYGTRLHGAIDQVSPILIQSRNRFGQ